MRRAWPRLILLFLVLALVPASAGDSTPAWAEQLGRITNSRLQELGRISDSPSQLDRIYLGRAWRDAAQLLLDWMREAGLEAWMDAVGNVRGRAGPLGQAAVLLGSHFDTVIDAGKFDGALGVVASITAARQLLDEVAAQSGARPPLSPADRAAAARVLPRPLEVVAFADEEGVRFASTFLGSRALAGTLDPDVLTTLIDASGATLAESLAAAGLQATRASVSAAAAPPGAWASYVELHLEQGPSLEAAGAVLGAVTSIAGQTRLGVVIVGAAGHAGATPMDGRRDALAAASEFVLAVEQRCSSLSQGVGSTNDWVRGTVGAMTVAPGVANTIPGRVDLTLDVRSPNDGRRGAAVMDLIATLGDICHARGLPGVACGANTTHSAPAAHLSPEVTADLLAAAGVAQTVLQGGDAVTCPTGTGDPPRLVSGAGHDAMVMAAVAPTGLLFVRCRGGWSHTPTEFVSPEDVTAGAVTLLVYLRGALAAGGAD